MKRSHVAYISCVDREPAAFTNHVVTPMAVSWRWDLMISSTYLLAFVSSRNGLYALLAMKSTTVALR
jgi:hypothetical protein